MDTPTTRPARVVAIGAIAAVVGGTMAARALISIAVALFFLAGHLGSAEVTRDTLLLIIPAALQLIFGVPAFVAGLGLIRYRWWARVMLELLGWIGGLFSIGYGIFALSLAAAARSPDPVQAVGVTSGLSHFLYAALLGLMIYHLHKPSVEEALSYAARRDERPVPDAGTGSSAQS